jgi:ubiquinone/menaquinone biosynthesis C-methylase UbiE
MKEQMLYKRFAKYYDLQYAKKKYLEEVQFINAIIKKNQVNGKRLLDVACGSGNHAKILIKQGYSITGVDLNREILSVARKKVPKAYFVTGDMRSFKLKRKFDIILCMYTSMNYNLKTEDFIKSLKNFKRHLSDNGLIFFDMPLPRKPVVVAECLSRNVTVLHVTKNIGKIQEIMIYWILKKGNHTEVFEDFHRLRLYTQKEIVDAIKRSGLKNSIYWDFSLNKKKGRRAILVCSK